MFARFSIHAYQWILLGPLALSAALGAVADANPKTDSPGNPEIARVSEAQANIPARDFSKMLFISPPYAQGVNVECFPYRAFDEKAGYRGGPYVKTERTVVTLENAYLRLSFLPSVGGRLWKAWCKQSNRPLFKSGDVLDLYALWKTGCGYMTTTMGLRFDFPEWGHDPAAEQEWKYETGRQDGKAWVRVWYREPRTQLEISERISLFDESAAIEIHTELENPNAEPRPYKYWTIAYVPILPDSRVILPCDFMTYHAVEQVWSWPISGEADISVPARWAFDTSYFAEGLRYGFAAIHSRSAHNGVARVFPLDRVRGVKLYSEGCPDYVNFYAGVAKTMEESLTLPARGRYEWTERYYPLDGLEGLTIAGAAAAIHASLPEDKQTELSIRIMAVDALDCNLRVKGEGIAAYAAPLKAAPLEIKNYTVPVVDANPDAQVAIDLTWPDGATLSWSGPRRELFPRAVEQSSGVEVGAEAFVNVGFEDYDDIQNRLPGWQARIWEGSGDLNVVSDNAFNGKRSVCIQRSAGDCKIGYCSDPVRVAPGEKYCLRFACQAQGLKPGSGGQTAHAILTDASGWKVVKKIDVPDPNMDWMVCEYSFAVPGGYDSLRVFLQLFGAGSVWFDDVSLVRLPDDAAVKVPAFIKTDRPLEKNIAVKPAKSILNGVKLAGPPRIFKLDREMTLNQPFGLSIDGQDNLFCFDGKFFKRWTRKGEFRALKITPQGKVVLTFGAWGNEPGEFFHPSGFAVAPGGAVYVADTGNNRISIFSGDGKYQRSFGEAGAGPGQFAGPTRMAFTKEGHLLISDGGNSRVVEYDKDGQFRRIVAGSELLSVPFDVSTDAAGCIYVADAGAHRVVVLEPDGKQRGIIGGYGVEPGRFIRPALLAAAKDGGLFVADPALARVTYFDAAGKYRRMFGSGAGEFPYFRAISGLALNSRGELIVLDATAPESVWICDPESGAVAPFVMTSRHYERQPLAARPSARGVSIAPDGSLVFFMGNGYEQNILRKCRPDGTVLWELGSTGAGPGQWNRIGQVAFDPAGNIWVLDRGNDRVQCLSPDGRFLKAIGGYGTGADEISLACDVAVAGNGLIYISDTANHRIQVLDPDGQGIRSITHGADFFPGPLLVTRSGDLWVRNMPDGFLYHFGADGQLAGCVKTLGVESAWPHINPLAETPDGNILVADLARRRFVCLTPDGKQVPAPLPWPANAAEVVRLVGPDFNIISIAFNAEGCLLVAGACERGDSFAVVRLEYP